MKTLYTLRLVPMLAIACAMFGSPSKLRAQNFDVYPAGDDVTTSLGQFQLVLDPQWRPIFDLIIPNSPLGTVMSTKHLRLYHNGVITSPTLYDPTTMIGRSDPFVSGGPEEIFGSLAGAPSGRTLVQETQLVTRPSWAGPTNGVREVHTFLKSMHLLDSFTTRVGFSVKAGMLATNRPASAGRVEGLSPDNDFPARSFFNVYVVVDLPAGGLLPPIQLVNVEPLLVQQANLYSFPPHLIYEHENSTAVPMYFNSDTVIPDVVNGTNINVARGTLFGQLTLAGHGVGFSSVEIEAFQNEIENESQTNSMPVNPTPIPKVTVEDFAPDYHAAPTELVSGHFDDQGGFVFSVGHLGHGTNYLQVRTNLTLGQWTTIATNVSSTNTITLRDTQTANQVQRFYRVTRTP